MPRAGRQTPTSNRARVDFPAAVGPMTPNALPGSSSKLMPLRIGDAGSPPGAVATTCSNWTLPSGRGRRMPGFSSGTAVSSSLSLPSAARADTKPRQLPTASSTGDSARPRRIAAAIIAPGVMCCCMVR